MICKRCHQETPLESFAFCPLCGARQANAARVRTRANGTGNAYRRGKTWTARVTEGFKVVDGKKVQVWRTKGGFRTRADALNYCAELSAHGTPRRAPSLDHYWQLYSSGEMERLSDSKRTAYKIAYDKCAALQARPIDAITVADLRETVAQKASTFYPARDMKVVLSHIFRLAAADGFANKDLPSFIVLPKLEETERESFTQTEQKRLWALYESGNKNAAIPLIMIYTGLMTGEMRRLSVSMIDFASAEIQGVGMKTKVRKKASVYIPDAIIPLLLDVTSGRTGLLFDMSETDFYETYYAVLEAAGVRRLTPYACRHTTATALAIDENVAPQTVQRIMRWSSTKMLDRYAHPSDDDAKTAINTLKRPDDL